MEIAFSCVHRATGLCAWGVLVLNHCLDEHLYVKQIMGPLWISVCVGIDPELFQIQYMWAHIRDENVWE
jgi:hypothetical protein